MDRSLLQPNILGLVSGIKVESGPMAKYPCDWPGCDAVPVFQDRELYETHLGDDHGGRSFGRSLLLADVAIVAEEVKKVPNSTPLPLRMWCACGYMDPFDTLEALTEHRASEHAGATFGVLTWSVSRVERWYKVLAPMLAPPLASTLPQLDLAAVSLRAQPADGLPLPGTQNFCGCGDPRPIFSIQSLKTHVNTLHPQNPFALLNKPYHALKLHMSQHYHEFDDKTEGTGVGLAKD